MPNELQGLLLLLGSALIFQGWKAYTLDRYRSELFALRDEAWMVAARSNALSHPSYLELRRELNGQIRTADSISDILILTILFSAYFRARKYPEPLPHDWTREYYDKSVDIMAHHMVVQAPLALAFLFVRAEIRRVRIDDMLARVSGVLIAGREESLSRGHASRGLFGGLEAR